MANAYKCNICGDLFEGNATNEVTIDLDYFLHPMGSDFVLSATLQAKKGVYGEKALAECCNRCKAFVFRKMADNLEG